MSLLRNLVTFASQLILLICLVTQAFAAVPEEHFTGHFTLRGSLIIPKDCDESITISGDGLTETLVPASSVIVNDEYNCSGDALSINNVTVAPGIPIFDNSELKYLEAQGDLLCGPVSFKQGSRLLLLKFPRRTNKKDVEDLIISSENNPELTEVPGSMEPMETDDNEAESTMIPFTSPSLSPTPSVSPRVPFFYFLGDVWYIIVKRCIFERTGETPPSPTPSSSPPPENDTIEPDTESELDPSSSPAVENDGPVCFPAMASVTLKDKSIKTMAELRVGDVVQTGPSRYSTVFAWTHQEPVGWGKKYAYVRLHSSWYEQPLILTPSHYVYVNATADGKIWQKQARPAGMIKPGDFLLGDHGFPVDVTAVDTQSYDGGLYNPQTIDGDLIVQGIQVSTYTTAVCPETAHALLTPVRALYRSIVATFARMSST